MYNSRSDIWCTLYLLCLNCPMYCKIVFAAEVGDYDPDEHGEGAGYLSEFKFCPKQVLKQ